MTYLHFNAFVHDILAFQCIWEIWALRNSFEVPRFAHFGACRTSWRLAFEATATCSRFFGYLFGCHVSMLPSLLRLMSTSAPSIFFNRTKLVRGIVDVIRQMQMAQFCTFSCTICIAFVLTTRLCSWILISFRTKWRWPGEPLNWYFLEWLLHCQIAKAFWYICSTICHLIMWRRTLCRAALLWNLALKRSPPLMDTLSGSKLFWVVVTLSYTILHYNALDYTTLYHATVHNTTVHYNTLQYATLITPHHNYSCNCNYTTVITLHYSYNLHYNSTTLQLHLQLQLQLHYTRLHPAVVVRWPLQPLQPLQKTQLQPPFGPSVDSPCQPWVTTTNPSYRFPIFETSAAALCGTTGIKL